MTPPPSLETVIQAALGLTQAPGVPGAVYPPQGFDAAPVCVDVSGAVPADQVCGLPPNVPGAEFTISGNSLFAAPQAPEGASPVDQALSQAAQARQTNDRAQFAYWSQRAVAEARRIPNGDVIAVPMVEADLLAIDGRFLDASRRYRALEASLEIAARRDPGIRPVIDVIKQRHQGVLAAGVATAAVSYAQAREGLDAAGMNQAQGLATACADEIYRLQSTERNLQMMLATYAQVGLDIRALRVQVAQNEAQIRNVQLGQVSPQLDLSGQSGQSVQISSPFFSTASDPTMTVEQLQTFNRWAEGVIARTEGHVYRMVGSAQADSPYTAAIQRSTALALMGNGRDALVELREARTLFTSGRVPRTPENLATEITVLHRLVGLSGISYDYHQEVLTEARGLITALGAHDQNQATLFTIENMEMRGELAANLAARRLSDHSLSDDDQEAAARDYQSAVREGQMEIVGYCETALGRITDRSTRGAIGDRMFGARAAVLEQDLGAALVRHQKDERVEARADAQTAIQEFQTFETQHRDVTSAGGYREAMGRATLAQAHYDFRTGRIEEAITTLRSVTDAYFDSSAARIVHSRTAWPHQYGIVDDRGEFRDMNQNGVMAAIMTGAAQLNTQQGRGLAMCGVGAGIFIAADLAVGEKVSGAAVLAGCAAGYTIDRAVLVAQASNEIGAAYRSGVTNVTTEEAVSSAGMFALNLASMYVGGAAGGLAERGVLAVGSRAGAEMTSFLVSRGLTPGPWTRAIGGFVLRESSYIGNSVAFHAVSSRVNHAGATAWSAAFGREAPRAHRDTGRDYLLSWLFVRAMPLAMETNLAGRVIRGEGRFDQMARTGINTGIGLGAVQGLHALATRDRSQISLDRLGGMAFDFLAMHQGNRAMESVLPMEAVSAWSARLDATTLRNMRQIRDDIENAPPSDGGWGGFGGGMQPAFAFAGGRRGGGAAALGGPGSLGPFELPRPGVGFSPILMMSADDATNPDGQVPARGRASDPVQVEGDSEGVAPWRVDDSQPVTPRSDITLDHNGLLQANGLLEFYNQRQTRATLDHYLRDRGPWGDAAETVGGQVATLRHLVSEYLRLQDAHWENPNPAVEAEMNLAGQDVVRVMSLIQHSSFDRMLAAHTARAGRLERELTPLNTALATLEVSSREGARPTVLYDVERTGPEGGLGLNMDFSNPQASFARADANELLTYNVSVANPQAGQRIVDRLRRDGLLRSSASFEGSKGTFIAEVPFRRTEEGGRVVEGRHQVTVRIHVDPALAARASATRPISRVDAAARGYEIAWNNGALWDSVVPGMDQMPILRDGQVAILDVRGRVPEPRGVFGEIATAATSRISADPVAQRRVTDMLCTTQAIYDRIPAGDPRRVIIDRALERVRGEVRRSVSGSDSLPYVWVTLSRAITDVAAREEGLPEGDRAVSRVVGISREISTERPPLEPGDLDGHELEAHYQGSLRYRWSPADAARALQ